MTKTQFTPLESGLCPLNRTEWEIMKKKRNCSDPEFYHCIPNQYNEPGEICVKANWASKNYCPIFNTDANDIDLIPCDLQYGACSDTDYRSNKVYQYPGCLNKTSIIETTTTLPEESQSDFLPKIVIPIVLTGIALLLVFAVICVLRRRKRNGMSTPRKDEEMEALNRREIPFEFHRLIKHLEAGVFITTEIYKGAVGILETHGWVTLIGPPGSGKTITAIELARRKLGQKGPSEKTATFHFCQSLNDVYALEIDSEEPYVILDDVFEQYKYYPSKFSEDKKKFGDIFTKFIEPGLVHVIFTVQKNTWVQYPFTELHSELFDRKVLVNFIEVGLTKNEKENMLRKHLGISHINITVKKRKESLDPSKTAVIWENTLKKIASGLEADSAFSVPVVIDLMCSNRYFLKNHSYITSKSFKLGLKLHVGKWMESDNEEDKKSFCIVFFAALCDGKISLSDFYSHTQGKIYKNVCKKFDMLPSTKEEIEDMMVQNTRVCGFLHDVENSDKYIFHHDSLLDAFLVCACSDEKFFIENVNIDYLIKHCKLSTELAKKYVAETTGLIDVNPENVFELKEHDLLAKRIHAEMLSGYSFPHWENHIFMTNRTFQSRWNATLSNSKNDTSKTERDDVHGVGNGEEPQKLSTHASVQLDTVGVKHLEDLIRKRSSVN